MGNVSRVQVSRKTSTRSQFGDRVVNINPMIGQITSKCGFSFSLFVLKFCCTRLHDFWSSGYLKLCTLAMQIRSFNFGPKKNKEGINHVQAPQKAKSRVVGSTIKVKIPGLRFSCRGGDRRTLFLCPTSRYSIIFILLAISSLLV